MTNTAGTTTPDAAAQAAAAAAASAGQQAAADQRAAADATAAAQQGQQGEQQQGEQQQQQQEQEPWADPVKAKAEIDRLRRERGDERMDAKRKAAEDARKELLQTLTKALDPDAKDGQPATVEGLTASLQQTSTQLQQTQGQVGTLSKELAVTKEAWKQGVDPRKLDYLAFTLTRRSDFAQLDPAADDFSTKLSAVITQAITEDSSLKLSGAAVGTGAEQFGGANGSPQSLTKEQFAALPVAEKSRLFQTNRAEFDRLSAL